MSLNFTVQRIEERVGEGDYTAQIVDVDYVKSNDRNYHVVDLEIMEPDIFAGKRHQVRYNTEHENEKARKIAINDYSKFCVEIGGLKEGDEPRRENFLHKVVKLKLRKSVSKSNGKTYLNAVSMELQTPEVGNNLVTPTVATYGNINIPVHNPAGSPIPINDEVPF